jgi:Na+-transporting methylmalonyl-CoA/oxaloacetate decarboxylase gamma subunit
MLLRVLGIAKDWSIILLAVEGILLSLVPLFVLYKMTQGLGKLIPRVVPALRGAHGKLLRVAKVIQRVMALIAAPFVWINSIVAGMRACGAGLRRILLNGR